MVQAQVIIEDLSIKPLPPTGKEAKRLWEVLKNDILDQKISPHGHKKRFTGLLKDDKVWPYKNENDFRSTFISGLLETLKREEAQAKISKKKTAKRTVHRFSMRRPAWPKDYREKLNASSGNDLRHVVRNATIKRALEAEQNDLETKLKKDDLNKYYQEMAKKLGVEPESHYLLQIRAIYKHLYLSTGNLFAAAGGVNQAIGISADPITRYGEELERKEDEPVLINDVVGNIQKMVKSHIEASTSKAKKMEPKAAENFRRGLNDYSEHLQSYLNELHMLWTDEYGFTSGDKSTKIIAEAWDLADDVIDFGDNLGFDLILTEGQAKRQAILVKAETALQSKDYKPGQHQLTKIFQDFLKADRPQKESRPTLPILPARPAGSETQD